MIGASDEFRRLLATLSKIAHYDAPVLIEGETGTGKELIARALHDRSARKEQPFVAINCGAIPELLIENELFGHRRGAFTDARDDRPGLVAAAQSGTLLLDEVDTLSIRAQMALLRFLQDQQYRPLGDSSRCHHANVRVIAATNRDLHSMSRAGAFRLDLFYRLQVLHLRVPPLRERRGDPRLLADHFVALAAARFRKPWRPISPETLAWFDEYEWPGNVRELEHLVYRAFLICDEEVLTISPPAEIQSSDGTSDGTATDWCLRYREAKARAIAAFEVRFLSAIMQQSAWNVTVAARLIGTDRRHLGRLLRRYRISRADA